ncbi:enhancer of polycomb-like protein, partial [Tremellales sp. Uapishka_1]
MAPSRMVTTSRRAGRVTNKTKLLIYRGSDKIDLGSAETIVWDHDHSASAEGTKSQHVGAKGVESNELQEHHLQAALSSASLLHSRPANASPSSLSTHQRQNSKPEPASTSSSSLAYHIPTPDATGLVENADYAKLYLGSKYVEPVNYIRFSDTVEESSGGPGGLGYCMDDEDVEWLTVFNSKAEGTSGGETKSPLQTSLNGNLINTPTNQGRGMRAKGKEKEKNEPPAPLFISEDTFEYVMGVLEKYAEDNLPTLDVNLSLLPTFSTVESLFNSPLPSSFFPSNELPKGMPEPKALTRVARSVFTHWRERKEKRKGKTIIPSLNYDETNDGDPYVCFRRRDVRAARKTRRTDNFSVERMQKIQTELRKAHEIVKFTLQREQEKRSLYKADKDLWEAKWKLFEIKRRWPSLGMTREEEEFITGRPNANAAAVSALHPSHIANIPQIRKKVPERDERERRDAFTKQSGNRGYVSTFEKSTAPEALKERMLALRQRLEEEMAKKRENDLSWDDCTDNSFQPLPPSHSNHAFRPVSALDPYASETLLDPATGSFDKPLHPPAFRLRRGRGGVVRLDRRNAVFAHLRGAAPQSPSAFQAWLFPDTFDSRPLDSRPKSIDVDEEEDETDSHSKRRRLNENWRYDLDKGGALGIGMGISEDDDRMVVDDFEPKYIRHRITLLQDEDIAKLQPDGSALVQALTALDTPFELPPSPVFVRPTIGNPQMMAAAQLHQQQMMQQQQQIEQFQRYQLLAQQQAMENQARIQQQQAAIAQGQAQQQQQLQQGRASSNGSET